jgi:BirA family biotin operon repressor/biotin-[acetyl-CoA-carboxylase] ligase
MQICDDSMEWAKKHLNDAPDGSVFLADRLTSAHGRGDRVWKTYDGQLSVTLLLKPREMSEFSVEDLPIRLNQLNMAVSLGVREAMPFAIGIKWPNDFVASNKKVGGIIFQLVWHEMVPTGVICGFSINVNNTFDLADELFEFATSLNVVTGKNIEMRAFYKSLLSSINTYYKKWKAGDFDDIYKSWRNAQAYLGKPICVHQKDGTVVSGRMMQVLPNGDMLLVDDKNRQKIISFYIVDQIQV